MPDSSDTPPPSSPEPNPPAPSLNYISPRDDPERKQREIALAVAGSVLTTIATLMVVFYWLGNNIRIHPPPAGSPSAPVSNTGPWIATFIPKLSRRRRFDSIPPPAFHRLRKGNLDRPWNCRAHRRFMLYENVPLSIIGKEAIIDRGEVTRAPRPWNNLSDSPFQPERPSDTPEGSHSTRNFLLGFMGGLCLSFIVLVLGRGLFFRPGGGEFFGVYPYTVYGLPLLGCCKLALGWYIWLLPRWKALGAGIMASVPFGALILFNVCALQH